MSIRGPGTNPPCILREKFQGNQMLHVDFQLHGGLTSLIPTLFKGQLYTVTKLHSSDSISGFLKYTVEYL